MELLGVDWSRLAVYLLKIGVSFGLALPTAWEREQSTRIMGLRTFPLVAVASCAYAHYEIALILSMVNFLTLRFLTPLEQQMGKEDRPEENEAES